MAGILSQEELEMLLGALHNGELAGEFAGAAPGGILQRSAEAMPFDFEHAAGLSTAQWAALRQTLTNFARAASQRLPALLGQPVEVRLLSLEQTPYVGFVRAATTPSTFFIADAPALRGQFALQMSLPLLLGMVERGLGGRGMPLPEARPLTGVEERIARRLAMAFLEALAEAWQAPARPHFELLRQENTAQALHLASQAEPVAVAQALVCMGQAVDSLRVCIPLRLLGQSIASDAPEAQTREMGAAVRAKVEEALLKAPAPVEFLLGQAHLRLRDLAGLTPGTVLRLNRAPGGGVVLAVDGAPCFQAHLGVHGGRRTAKVAGRLLRSSAPRSTLKREG